MLCLNESLEGYVQLFTHLSSRLMGEQTLLKALASFDPFANISL